MQYTERENQPGLTDLNLSVGRWRVLGLVLLGIAVVESCVLYEEPGAGVGICALVYWGIIYGSRREWRLDAMERVMGLVLVLSTLQAVRWTSFSNSVVMGSILLSVNGLSANRGNGTRWSRWLDGWLTFLRPMGVLETWGAIWRVEGNKAGGLPGRVVLWIRVGLPAVVLMLVFGWLLGAGNAVMGNWIRDGLSAMERFLSLLKLPGMARIVAWAFFGGLALVLACPARASGVAEKLTGKWPALGAKEATICRYQWMSVLLAMNLLFLFSSVTDVIYLWLSRELPDGVSHSSYLHKGVYVLILTTLLSAGILGTLTQHVDPVRKDRLLRGLAGLWMVQNLILISGVFLRLWIYVDAYGQTPKRVYVMLFLVLVIGGYALLGHAVIRLRSLRWLVGSNLWLLFGYFAILQAMDVPGWVVDRNIRLYAAGEIEYPEFQYLRQVGSHSIRTLQAVIENPQTPADRVQALNDLDSLNRQFEQIGDQPWPSFQYRDYRNLKRWEEFSGREGNLLHTGP